MMSTTKRWAANAVTWATRGAIVLSAVGLALVPGLVPEYPRLWYLSSVGLVVIFFILPRLYAWAEGVRHGE